MSVVVCKELKKLPHLRKADEEKVSDSQRLHFLTLQEFVYFVYTVCPKRALDVHERQMARFVLIQLYVRAFEKQIADPVRELQFE